MDRYMPLPDPAVPDAVRDAVTPDDIPKLLESETAKVPSTLLGDLRIEDELTPEPAPKGTPIGADDFDFDRANRGMLSEITDLPTRRGGGEILEEADVPRRRGMFPEITDLPTRRSGAEILQEQKAQPRRVDPTPPRVQLNPVAVPDRGQIPIPQPAQPDPAPTPRLGPQSEPRLESELAAAQMATQNGRFADAVVTQQRVDETPPSVPAISQTASVPAVGLGSLEIDDEPVVAEVPSTKLGNLVVDEPEQKIVEQDTTEQFAREIVPAELEDPYDRFMPDVSDNMPEKRDASGDDVYDQFLPDRDPQEDPYTAKRLRMGARTVAQGLSMGSADEIEAGITSAITGRSYDSVRGEILRELDLQRTVNPKTALFQDIGGGVVSGGALVNQLTKQGVSLARAGATEGALLGAGYGEGAEGKLLASAGFALAGGTLGKGIDWATSRSSAALKPTPEGGYTAIDEGIDGEILTATLKNDLQPGNTVVYTAPDGSLKKVEVISIQYDTSKPRYGPWEPENFVFVRDGRYQIKVPYEDIVSFERTGRSPVGALKDAEKDGQYQYVKAGPGGAYQQKQFSYLEEAPYQASNRTQRPQVLRPKLDKDGNPSIMPSGKAEWEMQDLTWRNAKTAGQFFDGVKFGLRNFYDQKLTPASDYVMREVAPRVGAIFQRYSESALRNNTIAFKTVMEPMEKLIKSMDEDKMLKAMVMDYTNMKNLQRWNQEVALVRAAPTVRLKGPGEQTITTLQDLLEYIARNYGNEQAIAFKRYLDWNKGIKADHVQRLSGVDEFNDDVAHHIHTRKMRKNPDEEPKDIMEELAMRNDDALEGRSRLSMVDDLRNGQPVDKVDQYFNPLLTDFRRTSNLEVLNQMSRLFNLKKPGRGPDVQPTDVFDELYRTLITRGISPEQSRKAVNAMKDDFIGQSKTPNNWLQFLNSWGYAGSLAGPKSALLNFHDVPMAAVLYGPGSFKGVFKNMGYQVKDRGIVQNVGEFQNYVNEQLSLGAKDLSKQLADIARGGTDKLMKYSAFGWADAVGKQKITQMIIQDAVDNVDSLSARWGFYFSRSELDQIAKQIRKHGTDVGSYTGRGRDLMEELFFAGLGQQQLISSAGRPLAWSRNPNFRFMWALRGFAMKQLALAHRNIIDNIAQGNKEAAWEYMKRYALFSAGSFGLLNEGRQWMWGDGEFTAGGVIMSMADQIVSTASINTIGLNDYQWGKMMQEGVAITFVKSLEPLMTSVPRNNLMDVVQALDGEFKNNDSLNAGQRLLLPPSQFPLIKQWSNAVENVEEDFGITPDPMAQFNRVYLQQEKVDG